MAVSYNEMMLGKKPKKGNAVGYDQMNTGVDPLVAAIQGGATGSGFGANNQAANMAPGVGGNVGGVDTSTTTATPSQGANTPPAMPPPPPPPGNLTATTTNPTSNPNFGRPPATETNPLSNTKFVQDLTTKATKPVTTDSNPLSNVSTVRAMTEERSKPPATETNPLSNTEFVRDLTTKATEPVTTETNPLSNTEFVRDLTTKATEPVRTETNPLSDSDFVEKLTADATAPVTTETNPLSNTEFVQDLTTKATAPVTPDTNPLSNPEYVQDLTAKATEPVRTETNPLSNPEFVKDLAEERSNQPLTENPLGDPDFVKDLTTKATALTENPLSDADFVKKLTADATEPSPYNPDAGADMAAMQNVVEPEAAPMADTLEDALRQQYMDRIGGTDDPIMASQLADQQFRQNEARKALVEQLGRYGVLRGGGDTAAALARMGEGDERNRLALEAQAAQRRQQDLRDAQGFDLGQRGMGLQETRSQQDTLTQALNRDIARAGQTGIFERDETMAAKRQSAELDALSRGQERADAALTGEFGDDGQKTLAGQQLESQLFGEIDGRQTLTGETTGSGLQTEDLQRRIAEAGQTGLFDTGAANMAPVETQQARALESELDTAALRRDATRAGLTGEFEDDPTLEAELRRAGLTGMLGDDSTLAGRQADMDLIGAILAGQELRDKPGTPQLLEGLTQNIQSFDPESVELIREALRTGTDFGNPVGDADGGFQNEYEIENELENVGAGGGTGGVINVVDGEEAGTRGNLGDEENRERQSVNRFLENNPDLGSGQLRIFVDKNGKRKLINASSGQTVGNYNAVTDEFERT